jgi:MTH538 TIR-like domain (DUF1863)
MPWEFPTHPPTQALLDALRAPKRRKIFVSYHHGGDQWYYNEFSRVFHDHWETLYDNSLERRIDSDDTRYVMQRIRDQYNSGTSCTIVLIGAQTHQRKYVDWEIKATLEKCHGLLGIVLPTHSRTLDDKIIVPYRFCDNVNSGFSSFFHWEQLNEDLLRREVHNAAQKSATLIDNSRPMKSRNG